MPTIPNKPVHYTQDEVKHVYSKLIYPDGFIAKGLTLSKKSLEKENLPELYVKGDGMMSPD